MLSLKVLDKYHSVLAQDEGEDFAELVYLQEYQDGDYIIIDSDKKNTYLHIQVDDALGDSFVYLTDTFYYQIPFEENKICYSPKIFSGNRHYLYVKKAIDEELYNYRNLALNPNDQHGNVSCFPHAYANVETRGESVFAARNAIDGVCANRSHGEWPYESWGINKQDDATITIDFGRNIIAKKIVLYTRADFPHDNWWNQVTLHFSDHTNYIWKLEKSMKPHILDLHHKEISNITMDQLIKADDPSPFPALTQFEVYGYITDKKRTDHESI